MLTIFCCAALASGRGFVCGSLRNHVRRVLRRGVRARLCPAPSCSIIGLSSAVAAARETF
jgi:hypothetical protein